MALALVAASSLAPTSGLRVAVPLVGAAARPNHAAAGLAFGHAGAAANATATLLDVVAA